MVIVVVWWTGGCMVALAVSPLSLGRLFRLLALGLLSAKLSLDTHWGHCCMLWQVIVSMVVHPLLFVAIFDVIHHSLSGNIGMTIVYYESVSRGVTDSNWWVLTCFQLVGPNL